MKKFSLLFLSVLLLFYSNISAQWEQKNGPYAGGSLNSKAEIFADGENLWAATDGAGVFLSTNGGRSWRQYDLSYPTNPDVHTFFKTDSGLIAATDFGIYRFNDNQWQILNPDLQNAFDFASDSTGKIWAATETGIWTSQDLGRNWSLVTDSLSQVSFYSIFIDNGYVFAGSGSRGIYRSSDWGNSWEIKNTGISYLWPVRDFMKINAWIYAVLSAGIYRTNSYGDYWESRSSNLDGEKWDLLNFNDFFIFAGTDEGAFRSTYLDYEWDEIDPNNLVYKKTYSLAKIQDTLFISTLGGIYKIHDFLNGTWEGLGLPISTTIKFARRSNENKIYAATEKFGAVNTVDHGESWSEIVDKTFGDGYAGYINDFAYNTEGVYIAATNGFYRKLETDYHWMPETSGLNDFDITNVATSNNAPLFISTLTGGVYYSISHGEQWHPMNNELPVLSGITDLAYCNDYVFAALPLGNGIYKYHFNGNDSSWTEANNGLENLYVNSLYVHNNSVYAATNNGLYKTDDNGENWIRIDNGINNTQFGNVFANDNLILAGASYASVFVSTDGGASWSNFTDNLHSTSGDIVSIFADDSVAYVGLRGKGVWTRPLSDFIVGVDENEVPSQFVLKQNYPNPFSKVAGGNPTTTIEYSIPNLQSLHSTSSTVQLIVYDILGRKIATLVNGKQQPGNYKVQFNAANLPNGIYFYTLRSGDFASTKKMILLK